MNTLNLAATLRAWRAESGLRPEVICARAGISCAYLHSLEYGRRTNPSLSIITGIASAYGRDARELLGEPEAAAS
jgi:transcriptional regulator with XRE-family HTH domain